MPSQGPEIELLGQNKEPITLTPDNQDLAYIYREMGLEVKNRDYSLTERFNRLLENPGREIYLSLKNLQPPKVPELFRHTHLPHPNFHLRHAG